MIGDLREEYLDVSNNMRHYANMRFAQLTLYFAFTAALVSAVFTANPPLGVGVRSALKASGVITAVVFAVMDHRACSYWHAHRRRAIELEKELGYRQYSRQSRGLFFTATNATRLLLWGGTMAWVVACVLDC
jgi:hypothetical protein